jgi:hypothetical protein
VEIALRGSPAEDARRPAIECSGMPPSSRPGEFRFDAVVRKADPAKDTAFIEIPRDVMAAFAPSKRVPVKATINGVPLSGTIATMGGLACLGLTKALRASAGTQPGDTASVVLARDDAERTVDVPPDLLAAMNARERERFGRLSYTHRKEYVRAIEDAKKPETRRRRIAWTVGAIRAKL